MLSYPSFVSFNFIDQICNNAFREQGIGSVAAKGVNLKPPTDGGKGFNLVYAVLPGICLYKARCQEVEQKRSYPYATLLKENT